ncbi:MAG: hypothetical protein OCC49_14975 [Fibrobacterales bacterium]
MNEQSIDIAFLDFLAGDEKNVPLERRGLNVIIFAAGILCTVLVLEAIVLQWEGVTLGITLWMSFMLWTLYYIARTTKQNSWLAWVYLGVHASGILVDWFLVAGNVGIAPMVFVGFAVLVPIITKRTQLLKGVILLVAVYTSLFLGTIVFDVVGHKATDVMHVQETLIEMGMVATCMFVVTFVAIQSYRSAHLRSYTLNYDLELKNLQLQKAVDEIKTLQGIIPICSCCKKIRSEGGAWDQIEHYISKHSDASFSHGVCPDCLKSEYPHIHERMEKKGKV